MQSKDEPFPAALWIDLDPPKELPDGRRFVFRVITRSHPWGYKLNDPSQRLTASERRDAFTAFEASARSAKIWQEDFRPGLLPPSLALPWDAAVPVPVPFLIDAIRTEKTKDGVWAKLERALTVLPFWADNAGQPAVIVDWRQSVKNLLGSRTPHMDDIVCGLKDNLGLNESTFYRIPALIVPANVPSGANGSAGGKHEDPLLTLFVRVNVAGTRPSDDELRFSMLKSVYPGVQNIAADLGRNLVTPAKLVTLLSRLILSRFATEPPGEPDLARFRQLVHGQDGRCRNFPCLIQQYLGLSADGEAIEGSDRDSGGRARRLIDAAVDLLGNGSWGLPAVSIANIAANSKSSSFFFLLLAWLDRLPAAIINLPIIIATRLLAKLPWPAGSRERMHGNYYGNVNISSDKKITILEAEDRRLLIGAITTLAWFAERPDDCLSKLWQRLDQHENPNKFVRLFSTGIMRECLASEGRRALMPALPPSILQNAVQQTVTSAAAFDAGEGGVWRLGQEWSRWHSLNLEPMARIWFDELRLPEEQRVQGATQGLVGHLWGMRELLHYAQRQHLKSWFADYDPSSPDKLEDTDRTWDYDHIFPGSYGQVNNLPQLIREWFASIGNLRVWPLEANRAGGDTHPSIKLEEPIIQERALRYGLRDGIQIRRASHVPEKDWPLWRDTTPGGKKPDWHRYLADPQNSEQFLCRPTLVRAITSRWVRLYCEWHTELRIGKLFESPS